MSRALRKMLPVVAIEISRDPDTGEHSAAVMLVRPVRQTFYIDEFQTLGGCLDGVARAALEHPDYQRHERFGHGRRE